MEKINIILQANILTEGRYSNQLFRVLAVNFISKNLCRFENLKIYTLYPPANIGAYGIQIYQSNNIPNDILNNCKKLELNENDIKYLMDENLELLDLYNFINRQINLQDNSKNILLNFNRIFCQTAEHSLKIYNFFRDPLISENIKNANQYKDRYNTNNDVFIHVRLDDVAQYNPGFYYYDKVMSGLTFTNGFISSDSITHPICQNLIHKYNLQIFEPANDIESIYKFASTCKYIIISSGTFSWFLGVFGLNSTVYYPDPNLRRKWMGDILECIPDWNKITY